MIVVFDESADLPLEIARQVIVVEQDAVLQRLMPTFDLALGLRMVRRSAHMLHTFMFEPPGQIVCDVIRSVGNVSIQSAIGDAIVRFSDGRGRQMNVAKQMGKFTMEQPRYSTSGPLAGTTGIAR